MKLKEMAKGMLPATLAALCLLGCKTTQGDLSGKPEVTVSVNGDPKTTTVPAQYMTWLPGYLYTYIFKISKYALRYKSKKIIS